MKKSAKISGPMRLMNLSLALDQPEESLRERALGELGVSDADLISFRIAKKSLDARGRRTGRGSCFRVHVDLELDVSSASPRLRRAIRSGKLVETPRVASLVLDRPHASVHDRHAVVVGAGPAGLFAALALARNGMRVTVIERGSAIERRGRELSDFHSSRVPNPESNLLFGEGGAGTYSDGKIYTRVDHPLEVTLLEELVACGAPPAIVYDSLAHIGTDKLHRIVPRLRGVLMDAGVEFRWNTRLDGIDVALGDTIRSVRTSAGSVECDLCVLALGHSARDTWTWLAETGVRFEAKPFQLGIRVEHPQSIIDDGRWGEDAGLRALGAASYQLTSRREDGIPAAHTFCMCPGGKIVASVNEPGLLCTNGMSNSTHSSRWANAAVVTTFTPEDFGSGPFDGVRFQRELETRFFEAGGADYTAPAQRVDDFLTRTASREVGPTSYSFGVRPERLDRLLPEHARAALAKGLASFDRMIPGFASSSGTLVGLESRSSGPVRAPRDRETGLAQGFSNLIPIGEGAGFAGGIMSAALDGAHSALACLERGIER